MNEADEIKEKYKEVKKIKKLIKIESHFIKGLKEKKDNWIYKRIINGDIKINLNSIEYDQKADTYYAELVTVSGNNFFGYVHMHIGKKRPIITSYCVSKNLFSDN